MAKAATKTIRVSAEAYSFLKKRAEAEGRGFGAQLDTELGLRSVKPSAKHHAATTGRCEDRGDLVLVDEIDHDYRKGRRN